MGRVGNPVGIIFTVILLETVISKLYDHVSPQAFFEFPYPDRNN